MGFWCNWKHSRLLSYLIDNQINMEPYSRNIISGGDNNGETLTDNADGNSVGIARAARE